jgi:chromosome segregation ATPase
VRLFEKDSEESKAQSPQRSQDPSIIQKYEEVINSKTQEINSLQIQLQNFQNTHQLVKQQLDNQTSHVELFKKQSKELEEKIAV